ncbi:RNA polymerase sigma factor, sigma-70 family [Gracilibacillus orientalis]|uniref:RNA polymerase sigma factor, sigma-70 family n=1 Tax=Gracilibacillus orientalis TaxID=334253 RepID=A0A1I4GVI8_9BACI|nr:sigma-70 family RNA polymerase sigma factor [Gracilibacillus orientalis]SFL34102.1 RNA polymerase sigma factor, sigma-70 family [Gracilibacillus orientalis]
MRFEDVLKDSEKMIYHIMHKYQIRDVEGEFYQEGLIALWHAFQNYDPSKSKFSTYAYYCITRRFINKIRKENRERDQFQNWLDQVTIEDLLIEDELHIDTKLLLDIQSQLSDKQWHWFFKFVLKDQSVRTIAKEEGVTENAVKNWGKLARKKIQKVLVEKGYF